MSAAVIESDGPAPAAASSPFSRNPGINDSIVRILLITFNYPPKVGGMENMLFQLVSHWQADHVVTVIGPHGSDAASDSMTPVLRPTKKGLFWFFMAALSNSLKRLRAEQFDVLFAGSALVMPLAVFLGRMFNLPVVTQVHGLDLTYPNRMYRAAIRRLLPHSNLVVANSANTARLAIGSGVLEKNIKVINPGLNFAEFITLPDRERVRVKHRFQGKKVILSAGRLAPRKGVSEFIEHVLPSLHRNHPDLLFAVAGGNPTESLAHREDVISRIRLAVKRINGADHVRVLGRVPRQELLELYAAADLFVLPALPTAHDVEGFGIVLIEAGAAGCPVVSTRHGGIPDAVVDGSTGVLVDPGDWEAMAAALSTLLAEPEAAAAMGRAGRQRAETNHDWSIVGREYLAAISNLITPATRIPE